MVVYKRPGRKVPVTISLEEEKVDALQLVVTSELGLGISRSKAVQIAVENELARRGISSGFDIKPGSIEGVERKVGLGIGEWEGVARNSPRPQHFGPPTHIPQPSQEQLEEVARVMGEIEEEKKKAMEEEIRRLGTVSPRESEVDEIERIKREMKERGIVPDAKIVNEPSGESV